MSYYRRRLPHWIPDSSILFITWRLAGSLPAPCADLLMPQHGAPVPFVQQDERLARSSSGPFWLRDPRVASMLQQALRYGETPHNLYFLHAWVIMPNHVHVILEPRLALPEIMRWLKGRTGRKANRILGRRGRAFWQDESYDHWVRTTKELNELIRYVENNPVQAGLVPNEAQWPWSSARMRADDTLPEALSKMQRNLLTTREAMKAIFIAADARSPIRTDDELRSSAPRDLLQM